MNVQQIKSITNSARRKVKLSPTCGWVRNGSAIITGNNSIILSSGGSSTLYLKAQLAEPAPSTGPPRRARTPSSTEVLPARVVESKD